MFLLTKCFSTLKEKNLYNVCESVPVNSRGYNFQGVLIFNFFRNEFYIIVLLLKKNEY